MTGEPAGSLPDEAARRPAGGRTPEDVRRVLAERISAGHLRPGQRLGAERALAAELGVSRATLRQALAVLAESGVVRRVPGRGGGTFVSQDKIERDTSRVVGVPALLRSQGVLAGTRVISAGLSGADEPAAHALGIQRGDLLIDLVRIRLADGSPISMERVMLPADRFPGLSTSVPGPGRRSSASRSPPRPRTRRWSWTCPWARRCSRSPGRPLTPAGFRSSSPTTCSAATGSASWCGPRESRRFPRPNPGAAGSSSCARTASSDRSHVL
jgi:Bacterial regulatory proteins, gntR family/UTRA domain